MVIDMRKTQFMLAAAISAFVSCTEEPEMAPTYVEEGHEVVLQVSLDDTKTALQDDYSVIWEDGDKIAVAGTTAHSFSIVSGGESTALFTGELGEDASASSLYAVCPESSFVSISGNNLTVNIPNRQKPVKDGFDRNAAVSVSRILDNAMVLKHIVALARFEISSEDITSVTIGNISGAKTGGNIVATIGDNGETSCSEAGSGNVLVVPEGNVFEPGVYYAAIAPSSLSGGISFSFTRSTDDKLATRSGANPVSFEKGTIMNFGVIDRDLSWKETTKLSMTFVESETDGSFTLADGKFVYLHQFETPEKFGSSIDSGTYTGEKAVITALPSCGHFGYEIFSTTGIARHSMGFRWGKGAGDYIAIPRIDGLTLSAVRITFGGNPSYHRPFGLPSIKSSSGPVIGGDCYHAEFTPASTAVWHILNPDPDAQYRIELGAAEECDLIRWEFFYEGTAVSPVCNLTCKVSLQSGSTMKAEGSFATLNPDSDYSCGFEYCKEDCSDWTSVGAEKGMSFTSDITLEPDCNYLIRSWVDIEGKKTFSEAVPATTKTFSVTFDFTAGGSQFEYPSNPVTEEASATDSYESAIILPGNNYCTVLNYLRSGTRKYNDEWGVKWVAGAYLFFAASKDSYFVTPAVSGATLSKVEVTYNKDNTTGSSKVGLYDFSDNILSSLATVSDSSPISLVSDTALEENTSYKVILSKGESKKDRQAMKSITFHYTGIEKAGVQYVGQAVSESGVLSSAVYVNALASAVSCGFEYKPGGAGDFVPVPDSSVSALISGRTEVSTTFTLAPGDVVRAWASVDGGMHKTYGKENQPLGELPLTAPGVRKPDAAHDNKDSLRDGIPAIAVSNEGRIWVTWYSSKTKSEDETNYVVLTSSTDGGSTWAEHLICDPDGFGMRRVFDPQVWIAPDGNLRWTWTDRVGNSKNTPDEDRLWMMTLDAETGATVEEPRVIATGVMACKPTVLSNGDWLFPVARWKADPSACAYVSSDNGKTFVCRGGLSLPSSLRGFDEHSIVQKSNGNLKLYFRAANSPDNCIWESESTDLGVTWSEAVPSVPQSLGTRNFVTKLSSGKWMMVKNGKRDELLDSRDRLTVLISEDEGETWTDGVEIDSRSGCTYPDGCQTEDGNIYIINDYDRTGKREISYVVLTEDKLSATSPSPKRIIISCKQ